MAVRNARCVKSVGSRAASQSQRHESEVVRWYRALLEPTTTRDTDSSEGKNTATAPAFQFSKQTTMKLTKGSRRAGAARPSGVDAVLAVRQRKSRCGWWRTPSSGLRPDGEGGQQVRWAAQSAKSPLCSVCSRGCWSLVRQWAGISGLRGL